MLNIAVVEDDLKDLENLKECINSFFTKDYKARYIITHYGCAEAFLEDYKNQFDLIFMDIDLPESNGVTAAKKLRAIDQNVAIVFLTNLSHYAMNGWEVNALDYILKPINAYSFSLKMPKILHYMEVNNEKQITITSKNSLQRFYVSDVYYIEVMKHDLIYHTKIGNFVTRGTMKECQEQMEQYQFVKCNNCFLVNLKYVQGIKDNYVTVGSDSLAMSRTRKTEFINALTDYIGGRL